MNEIPNNHNSASVKSSVRLLSSGQRIIRPGLGNKFGNQSPGRWNRTIQYFCTNGKDAKEYAVIEFPQGSQITSYFPWKPMDESAWKEVSRLINDIELYISRNKEESPIPAEYMPSQDMLYTMVGDYPSLANPYVFFVFSPSDMRVHVLINLT